MGFAGVSWAAGRVTPQPREALGVPVAKQVPGSVISAEAEESVHPRPCVRQPQAGAGEAQCREDLSRLAS